MNTIYSFPKPKNEPVQSYAPGTAARRAALAELEALSGTVTEIPLLIGGREVYTGNVLEICAPHDHKRVIARVHQAGRAELQMAIANALQAKKDWAALPCDHRAAVFQRAAELLAGKYRYKINAATMLGQSKTMHQAEIDSACEMIDFLRFNAYFMSEIYANQPNRGMTAVNRTEYRPMEGVILAISPFNFTSIGGNLCTSPALMGNTVLWKPAENAVLSNYILMQVFAEAGLPAGVINFVPCDGPLLTETAIESGKLGGIHFTGSTKVFNTIWKSVAAGLDGLQEYPRMVGETGGKDFLFAHSSCDPDALTAALIRGSFEYQGQKCSACSRAYIPRSIWSQMGERFLSEVEAIRMGNPADPTNFVNAVIHRRAFENIRGYIERAAASSDAEILCGGRCDDSEGYFVRPTVILAHTPDYETMREEIFGPVLTVYLYDDDKFEETLALCEKTSTYGLTGSIFARDRLVIRKMLTALTYAAGNVYINDKTTGAVVGQQPFGGGRKSGTNDKAGSQLNLLRWVSARTITENYDPAVDYRYDFLAE